MQQSFDAFISHSGSDIFCLELHRQLREAGFCPFLDSARDIRVGESWRAALVKATSSLDLLAGIVVVGNAEQFLSSDVARRELRDLSESSRAKGTHKMLVVPVFVNHNTICELQRLKESGNSNHIESARCLLELQAVHLLPSKSTGAAEQYYRGLASQVRCRNAFCNAVYLTSLTTCRLVVRPRGACCSRLPIASSVGCNSADTLETRCYCSIVSSADGITRILLLLYWWCRI
jgi:TIR domain